MDNIHSSFSDGPYAVKLQAAFAVLEQLHEFVAPTVVTVAYPDIKLTPTQELIIRMLAASDEVLTRERACEGIRGFDNRDRPQEKSIDHFVLETRKAIAGHGLKIGVMHGGGYMMSVEGKERLRKKAVRIKERKLRWSLPISDKEILDQPHAALAKANEIIHRLRDVIDPEKQPKYYRDTALTAYEGKIVSALASASGVVTFDALAARLYDDRTIWGIPTSNSLSVLVHYARKKLEKHEVFIENDWGHGFFMEPSSREKLKSLEGLPLTDAEMLKPNRECLYRACHRPPATPRPDQQPTQSPSNI